MVICKSADTVTDEIARADGFITLCSIPGLPLYPIILPRPRPESANRGGWGQCGRYRLATLGEAVNHWIILGWMTVYSQIGFTNELNALSVEFESINGGSTRGGSSQDG